MTTTHRGLTWDHPRGRTALETAAREWSNESFALAWDAQPLEGFESAPIAELAARYDLLVLDHPHLGDALATGCLVPMEDIVGAELIADIGQRAVGPSLETYRLGGATWALPLDAATQVSARRPDLMASDPTTWDDVADAAHDAPVALSLSGPHAYLTFASVCQSLGHPLATARASSIVDLDAGVAALRLLSDIAKRAPEGSADQNPIALLERMTAGSDIAFIPLVYGYVGYAAIARSTPVVFGPAPTGPDGRIGSTIGGTGIAVTRRCEVTDDLRAHLVRLLTDQVQTRFIPEHDGQPAMAAAWDSDVANDPVGAFYRRTRSTIEGAWIRPRFAGFTAAQSRLSAAVRSAVLGTGDLAATIDALTSIQNEAAELAAPATYPAHERTIA